MAPTDKTKEPEKKKTAEKKPVAKAAPEKKVALKKEEPAHKSEPKKKADAKKPVEKTYFQKLYDETVKPALMKDLGLTNVHEIPAFKKVVINMGVGEAVGDNKVLDKVQQELTRIAGQKAVKTRAKKSIATFKVRQGMELGLKVTLRHKRMMEFLERLVNIALPRVRDFRGLSTRSFDKQNNYNLGIKEHIVFPEVDYDTISKIRGMDICINIASKSKEHSIALLKAFNFPINVR